MTQKGGIMLPFKNEKNNKETFLNYLKNSDIGKLSMGSYGLTLMTQLVLNPSPESVWGLGKSKKNNKIFYHNKDTLVSTYKIPKDLLDDKSTLPFPNYYKKMEANDSYGSPITNLVVKFCIISNDSELYINNIYGKKLHAVSEENFQNEINVQTDIYLKTMKYLQSICPGIVYADIVKEIRDIKNILLLASDNGDKELQEAMSNLYMFLKSNKGAVSLGIIGMELAGTGQTLLSLDRYFTSARDFRRIRTLKNVARYTLLKMALDTEYNQNDFHTNNIIMISTPDYFDDGEFALRGIVIDYGRAVKIPPVIMTQIRDLVGKKDYVKALTYLCDKSYTYKSINTIEFAEGYYGWVCGDYNMSDIEYEEYIKNLLVDINKKISEYNSDPATFPKKTPYDNFHLKLRVPRPLALEEYDNNQIDNLFNLRELAIDKNVNNMKILHDSNPSLYPLLPLSNEIKNSLYNGMIGGRKNSKTKRRQTNKNKKSNRNYK